MMLCWDAKNCLQYISIAEAAFSPQTATHAAIVGTALYLIPVEIPVKKAQGSLWQKGEVHCIEGSEICKGAKVIHRSM